MNEVTRIHLGRQPFTVSVEAHQALKTYIAAIRKQVDDQEVVDEIELRMAELLRERGIAGDKVVLETDIDFLKQQLGEPQDFQGDDASVDTGPSPEGKRLFRDTENAILAGVASGLAKYFGIDVWLIRIVFILGIFTGGWGILLYAVLWLLVPEAKTSSDRLRMAGKPVTVDGIKEVVARADVAGAAKRANATLAAPVRTVFNALLKIIGLGFVVGGLALIFALAALESYVVLHNGSLVAGGIFPVGFKEHLLVHVGVAAAALIAVLIILLGLAIFKQKWPLRTWVTGTVVGLIFVSLACSIALAADAAPRVRDRYNAEVHTTVRSLPAFTSVKVVGGNANVSFQTSSTYGISMRYFDNPDLSSVKTTVSDGTLLIDTSRVDWRRGCSGLCIPDIYNVTLTVQSPLAPQLDKTLPPLPPDAP